MNFMKKQSHNVIIAILHLFNLIFYYFVKSSVCVAIRTICQISIAWRFQIRLFTLCRGVTQDPVSLLTISPWNPFSLSTQDTFFSRTLYIVFYIPSKQAVQGFTITRFGDCFYWKLLPEYTIGLGQKTAVVLPTRPTENRNQASPTPTDRVILKLCSKGPDGATPPRKEIVVILFRCVSPSFHFRYQAVIKPMQYAQDQQTKASHSRIMVIQLKSH